MMRSRGEEYNDKTTIPNSPIAKVGKHACKVARAGLAAAIELGGFLGTGRRETTRI